jgi:hypothetical protein
MFRNSRGGKYGGAIIQMHQAKFGNCRVSKKKNAEEYSDEETQRRFEAALRGAREVGHEPMKDIPPKRAKPPLATKVDKRKAKAGTKAVRWRKSI